MPIVPLVGHADLRDRLRQASLQRTLPSSMLLQGTRGVGKQRFALWLGQMLLCDNATDAPCGSCRPCRFALELTHPDLHWYFPRPRPKDSDPDLDDVRADYAEAVAERAKDHGLYAPPSGSEGIFVATVRAIVQMAAISPALGARKVFIIGDAERMVPQEGSEQAANAFLKLLEEPPADTTVILTSSEPGSLLPTIRSRVGAFRLRPLPPAEVNVFLDLPEVRQRLSGETGVPADQARRVTFAAGAPGRLLAGAEWGAAMQAAGRLLDAATNKAGRGGRYDAAWAQASTKARGSFADVLDALSLALHDRVQTATRDGHTSAALGAARAVAVVEEAKERIASNVSPQLITVNLLRELQELMA